MEDPRYIVDQINSAQARARQFEEDIRRLENEKNPNRSLISQKHQYLAHVRNEISRLESKLK